MKRKLDVSKILESIQNLEHSKSNRNEMIDKYIGDDEQSRDEFDAYLDVWEKSANLKDFDKVNTNSDWQKVRSRMKIYNTRKRIPFRTYFIRVAAILIFAFGMTYLLTKLMENVNSEDAVYTEIAASEMIENVELGEGSIITLNKGAKIIYNDGFGESNRDIILEGEAFFEVARDESLPFRVHSMNSTVEVLGTRFRVFADTHNVIVGVVSGKVALYESDNTINRVELLAENTGYFHPDGNRISSDPSFDANSIAWHTHQFVFRDMPLQDVCQVLADFYKLELIKGKDVEFVESVTVTCSTKSLDEVLFSVNNSLVGSVKLLKSDKLLIVSKQ